jgi:hypothetical protein
MRDFHLRFYIENRWFDGLIDLMVDDEIEFLPEKSGAYVIGTSDGTMLTYPWGSSPIFYIAQSSNLYARLSTHKEYIFRAMEDHE